MATAEALDMNQTILTFLQKKSSQPSTQNEAKCKYCNDTGWEYDWETNTARECRCGLRQRQIMENKLKFAALPDAYKNVRVADIKPGKYLNKENQALIEEDKKAVMFWLEHLEEFTEQGKGLYFYSNTKGSGKTMMATAIANEMIYEHKKNVKFATSMQILSEIKATWDKESDMSENELLKDLTKVDYLIIDDFGTESVKGWMEERFYTIINSRYIDKKVTIFTANYSIKECPYDERITNRILERNLPIRFPEESVRETIARFENARFAKQI